MIVDLILDGMVEAVQDTLPTSWSDLFHKMPLPATRDLWDAPTNFAWQTAYERRGTMQRQARASGGAASGGRTTTATTTTTTASRGWGTTKPVTVRDVLDADLAGGLRNLKVKDPRFDFLPDVYLWCEGMDSLGSLLWMIFPFEQWRRRSTGMEDKW
jgi:hypothetical protein